VLNLLYFLRTSEPKRISHLVYLVLVISVVQSFGSLVLIEIKILIIIYVLVAVFFYLRELLGQLVLFVVHDELATVLLHVHLTEVGCVIYKTLEVGYVLGVLSFQVFCLSFPFSCGSLIFLSTVCLTVKFRQFCSGRFIDSCLL